MLFNSLDIVIFLPILFIIYWFRIKSKASEYSYSRIKQCFLWLGFDVFCIDPAQYTGYYVTGVSLAMG